MVAFGATGRARARSAAGVTWTSRTANAPWEARASHTSVIDAAGAIYVIGGQGYDGTNEGSRFQDVWASTDGARPDLVRQGYLVGTQGGTKGYRRVLRGSTGY